MQHVGMPRGVKSERVSEKEKKRMGRILTLCGLIFFVAGVPIVTYGSSATPGWLFATVGLSFIFVGLWLMMEFAREAFFQK